MEKFTDIIKLIFKAVALAMGVGVVVLMIMDAVPAENAILLLGVGLASVGIERLIKPASSENK